MSVIGGKAGTLSATVFSQMAGYRLQAANTLSMWQPPRQQNYLDHFDGHDAVYVVSRDGTGQVNGCARLLPTVKPYPLREVCPELMQGALLPASDEVWELSQFAATDFNQRSGTAVTSFPCEVAIVLLREALGLRRMSRRHAGADGSPDQFRTFNTPGRPTGPSCRAAAANRRTPGLRLLDRNRCRLGSPTHVIRSV